MSIKDPVRLFQTIVDRLNAEDWSGAAGLCDPTSLSAFRRTMLEQFSPNNKIEPMTVEQFMKNSPDMPREVAEYFVKQSQQMQTIDGRLEREFPGVASVATLRALEPAEFYAEWIYGRSPQRQLRDQAKAGTLSKRAADALISQKIAEFPYEAIGSLPDGDRIAHVLYRFKPGPDTSAEAQQWLATVPEDEREFVRETATRPDPLTMLCRRQPDGGWLAVADHRFIGTGTFISRVEEHDPGDDDQQLDETLEISP